MKKLSILYSLLVLLVLLGALFSLTAFAQEQKREQTNSAPVESLTVKVDKLFAQWDKPNSPGCALGIIKDGSFVYKRGYGMANLDYNIPISADTSFTIGAVSMQFTAMSIALLARDGKLSLNDDIRKYLPEIPQYQSPITIRHLIHHTSGIRDFIELSRMAGRNREDFYSTDEDYLKLISRQKRLNFNLGDEYLYSNSNYFLLGQIVKRASGKSLRVFADERIFKPLGMVNTFFRDDRREIIKKRATGYVPRKDGFSIEVSNYDSVGSSGIFTTAEDLLLWDKNFYDNKLGRGADLINQMLTTQNLNNGDKNNYAFGLSLLIYKRLKLISHGGSTDGFRAGMLRFPEQKFSVICLCNLESIDPTVLAQKVADIYLDEQIKQAAKDDGQTKVSEPVILKPSEQELNDVAGFYFNPLTETYRRVIVKDGKLMYVRGANNSSELQAVGEGRFLMADAPSRTEVSFKSPKPGAMKNMYLVVDSGKPAVYESFKAAAYTPEDLSRFAGTFYSDELDAKYILSVKENKLTLKFGSEESLLEALFTDAFANPRGLIIRFKRDEQNRISGFSMTASRVRGIVFRKI